jgi:cytochrome c peroxidase
VNQVVLRTLAITLTLSGCWNASEGRDKTAPPADTGPGPIAATNEGETDVVNPRMLRRFKPVHAATTTGRDPKVELGKKLFLDPRLSHDGRVSCDSCHDLRRYGVDGTALSIGIGHQTGTRNAPTVYNAFANFTQFWDGRAATLEEQAKGPILNPAEMGSHEEEVAAVLAQAPDYDAPFKKAFPGTENVKDLDHVAIAIAAFERTLVTPSRWDAFLLGDSRALSREEQQGLKVFINSGCMVCHTGVNLGGASFERLGVVEPWPNTSDRGRMNVTGSPSDSMLFKVPTLRNVSRTAPYFHDGSAATLAEAVQRMGRHQLGLDLNEAETGAIVAWLDTLTGDLPAMEP